MPKPVIEFGEFRLELEDRVLRKGAEPVPLTPKAFETLVALVECRDRVADRAELIRRLWPDHAVEEGNLNQQIFTLRKALGDTPDGNLFIRTIPRRGYRFVAEVRVNGAPDVPTVAGAEPAAARSLRGPALASAAIALLAVAYVGLGRRPAPATADRIMLAVLPFENLSESADDEYLADGLTEEIITVLARLSPDRLGVIARTSVLPYRSNPKPVREVGRDLSVDYVVEGSVRHARGRVRITAQLIEVKSQSHLWAETFEHELSDLFRTEAEIAETIGRRLSLRLLPRSPAPLAPLRGEAHVAYLKGLHFWNKRTEAGLRRAIELFQEALDLDPGYARAQAGLATSHARLATSADVLGAREARALAEAGARRALALDPSLPEAHAALAIVSCQFDWNWPVCEQELARTLAQDPNYASGRHWLGEHFVQRGRFEQGLEELKKARTLDPISPTIHTSLGIAFMYARRYEEALACYAQALEIDPDFLLAHRVRGLTLLRAGRALEGLASLEGARRLSPQSAHAAADLAYALAQAGRAPGARAVLRELVDLERRRPVSAYDFAVVHAGLGDHEATLRWLEKGYEDGATGMRWVKVDPIFDGVRREPRFQELLRKLAIPD